MVRKHFLFIISMVLVFNLVLPISVQASEEKYEPPRIVIAKDNWMPVYQAGETVNLSIPVENLSSTSATNVRFSITPGDPASFPFEMDKMTFTKYAYSLSGNSVFSYKVTIPANTKPGVYPIAVNLTYDEGGGESATVYVKIVNEYKQPELKLMGVDFEGDKLSAGKSVLIKLRLHNEGDLNLEKVELKLNGFSNQGINLDNWPDTQHIKAINGRETKLVEYKLIIDSKLESGTYPLDLNITYYDEHDKEYKKDAKVYLPIDGKGATDDLTPRVIVDNYYFPYEYVEAGQAFPLTVSFFNTSETTTVKNIKVSLNADELAFSPVGSSNSFFIAEINPRETIERSITFKAKVDAENRNYTINTDIDFQDSNGNKYTEKEIISIPVKQNIALTVSNIEMPPQIYLDTPTSLSIDFYNTGRTLIRNLIIKTEGNFEIQEGNFFVGNLEPGKDNYYDVTIIPHEEGEMEGKIVFSYEDNIGEQFTTEVPFTINSMMQEMPPMMEHDMDMSPEAGKFKLSKKVMVAGGGTLLLILALIALVIRRRKKKQEEVFLDE